MKAFVLILLFNLGGPTEDSKRLIYVPGALLYADNTLCEKDGEDRKKATKNLIDYDCQMIDMPLDKHFPKKEWPKP